MSSAMMVAAGAKSFNSQMLRPERDAERRDARDIRAWVIEAGDGPDRHRVRSHLENDGNRRGRRLQGCRRRDAIRDNGGRASANQIRRHFGQSIVLIVGRVQFDRQVATLDKTGFAQAVPQQAQAGRSTIGRSGVEISHQRQRRLLRACG